MLAAGTGLGYIIAHNDNSFKACQPNAYNFGCECNYFNCPKTQADHDFSWMFAGAVVGAHVGALVGFFVHTEAWTRILNVRVRVAVTPKNVGISTALALDHWP